MSDQATVGPNDWKRHAKEFDFFMTTAKSTLLNAKLTNGQPGTRDTELLLNIFACLSETKKAIFGDHCSTYLSSQDEIDHLTNVFDRAEARGADVSQKVADRMWFIAHRGLTECDKVMERIMRLR